MKFEECASCAGKAGTPTLCESCINNREFIENLKKDNSRLLDEHDATRLLLVKRTASLHIAMEMVIEAWEAKPDV